MKRTDAPGGSKALKPGPGETRAARAGRFPDGLDRGKGKEAPAAAPHSPGNVVTVKSMKGKKVNQILIGSCTNSSYRDIRTVALYLKGKHVADDVEVGIACGSRQVVNMLAKDGSLAILHAAGCRMLENACGSYIYTRLVNVKLVSE